jgi:glutaredoxin
MTAKYLIVVSVILLLGLAPRLLRQRQQRLRGDQQPLPPIPETLRGNSDRTYVIFTTKYCAQCGPVEAQLRRADPEAHVVRVDAEREPQLAAAFRVRSAPTVLLADSKGRVQRRLVGADAVKSHMASAAAPSTAVAGRPIGEPLREIHGQDHH